MRTHHHSAGLQASLLADDSSEFRALKRAVSKAHGDRERATKLVCRLYSVNRLDHLPGAVMSVAVSLIAAL
jgi:hypothetical protein